MPLLQILSCSCKTLCVVAEGRGGDAFQLGPRAHPLMQRLEKAGDEVAGASRLVPVPARPAHAGELLCTGQQVLERIQPSDWLKVVRVVRVQGYQAPVRLDEEK